MSALYVFTETLTPLGVNTTWRCERHHRSVYKSVSYPSLSVLRTLLKSEQLNISRGCSLSATYGMVLLFSDTFEPGKALYFWSGGIYSLPNPISLCGLLYKMTCVFVNTVYATAAQCLTLPVFIHPPLQDTSPCR